MPKLQESYRPTKGERNMLSYVAKRLGLEFDYKTLQRVMETFIAHELWTFAKDNYRRREAFEVIGGSDWADICERMRGVDAAQDLYGYDESAWNVDYEADINTIDDELDVETHDEREDW